MKRLLIVLSVMSLVAGVFAAAPAQAKKKKPKPAPKCAPFSPVEPDSNSEETAEALEAPVNIISAAHTEDSPFIVEYEHGPALWETASQMPIQEDTAFFNIQIAAGGAPTTGLYVRQEWGAPSFSDFDLYVYDATGAQVFNSGSANLPEPIGGPGPGEAAGQETGAQGYESISGAAVTPCGGFTIESRAFATMGESMTLKVWLGPLA